MRRDRQLCRRHLHASPTPPAPTARSAAMPRRRSTTAATAPPVTAVPDHRLPLRQLERRQHGEPADRHQRDGEHQRDGHLRHRHLHADLHGRHPRHDQRRSARRRSTTVPTAPPVTAVPDHRLPLRQLERRRQHGEPADRPQRDGRHERHGHLRHRHLHASPTPPARTARSAAIARRRSTTAPTARR